eukprot:CAMPEP_0183712266 /NCGR_PEP_ID=MMETSP0737-20130205/7432_1 /TAXON_ID=385413 /ORGANISM="Thalassiosira miniscula, Strain CCMP1093" /LENGTH=476 /DNA_ID=CAMNT_0025940851 /DNA_START=251 /DNA_END=1681 /DNA_ORIENTATION=-
MKLLSKMRANKRASASASGSEQRPGTPRELAAIDAAEKPTPNSTDAIASGRSSSNNDGPMGPLACCVAGPTTTMDATDGNYHPLDEESNHTNANAKQSKKNKNQQQSTQQQQQHPKTHYQQSIVHELFLHFRQRSLKKKLFTALVVLTMIPVFLDLFVFHTGYISNFCDFFLEWMADHPLLGVWAYVSMITLTSLIFIPSTVLIFAAGFVFQSTYGNYAGILIAIVASFLGSTLGGVIGFYRAKYMTRDLVVVLMQRYPLIKAVDAAVVRNSLRVMMLLRLNPLIPFGVLNYVFGITGVEWAAFVLAMVGILPGQMLLVVLGASAESMLYEEESEITVGEVILMGMGIAFGIIGLVITWKFAKKELQKEVEYASRGASISAYRITSPKLQPWRSKTRKSPEQQAVVVPNVEDADLYAADYFFTQCLGNDHIHGITVNNGDDNGSSSRGSYYGTEVELEDYYQAKLSWNEVLLDDFS